MPRNSKAKRPRGLKTRKCPPKSNEPTNKELMPWFERYGQWLAMNLEEKKDAYPGVHEGIDQFGKKNKNGKYPKVKFRIEKGTDREFAKLAGVRVETLSQWMHKPELKRIRDQHLNLSLIRLTPAVFRGLARNAISKGQPHAVREFFKQVEGNDSPLRDSASGGQETLGDAADDLLSKYLDD